MKSQRLQADEGDLTRSDLLDFTAGFVGISNVIKVVSILTHLQFF